MKLFITGGAGFIGSSFVKYWLERRPNDEIINLDKLSYAGNVANFGSYRNDPRHRFVQGNILDTKLVEQLINGADYAVHFAAESHVTRSEDTPEIFYENNVAGTQSVIDAARSAGKKLKKFIHISTDEVYGSIESGYFQESDKAIGDQQASSAYAKSKSLADDIARTAFNDLPIIIVRPTNNFGPNQYPEKALPRWITNALLNEPLYVWGEGNQVRDWLFTKDTARALELILEKANAPDTYNIGANHQPEHSNIEIAKRVLKLLGKDESLITFIPDPRPDHDFRYGVDTKKIEKLGWKKGDFDSQLAATVRWYQENPQWWQPLKAEAESLYASKEKK